MQHEIEQRRLHKREWIRLASTHGVLRKVFERYNERKQKILFAQRQEYCANRLIRVYRRQMALQGANLLVRNERRIKNTFSAWATFAAEGGRERAGAVLEDFLSVTAMNFSTLKRFEGYYLKIVAIQLKFRKALERNNARMEVL